MKRVRIEYDQTVRQVVQMDVQIPDAVDTNDHNQLREYIQEEGLYTSPDRTVTHEEIEEDFIDMIVLK
jgi:hypothetical protein